MRWFQGFQTRRSGETAEIQLEFLLVSDKADCSSGMILTIKDGMVHAISKYMEVEKDKVQIQVGTEGSPQESGCRTLPVFHTNIPIRSISNKRLY